MADPDEAREKITQITAVIDATRVLFHRLSAVADEVHRVAGLTAGPRGVLQDLYQNGPRTVPDMARARPVSRQHIQVLVNTLLERGEVELLPNPAHARSKLVALTDVGMASFDAIRHREAGCSRGYLSRPGRMSWAKQRTSSVISGRHSRIRNG